MSELPRALARWHDELSQFPEEVGLLLGNLVARLAPAFDAAARLDTPDRGEIDGFDGLSRRGTPERLLPTEWALARLVPLEFLRRAAQAEQQYYKLAHRVPARPRGSVVLLEAGPDQLGAPRLAQLALLILLFERARRARGSVGWQLVHRQGEPLLVTFDRQSVQSFLRGRTAVPSSPGSVEAWCQPGPDGLAGDELWLVGPPTLVSTAPAHYHSIAIRERVDPSEAVLDVEFRSRQRVSCEVVLPLPEPGVAARVLRDPFETPPVGAGVRPPRPDANLLLSPTGGRLFYRDSDGDLVELFVPRSHAESVGPGRRHPAPTGTSIVAAGMHGRTLAWLGVSRGVAVLTATKRLRRDVPPILHCPAPIAEGPAELWPLVLFTSPLNAVFVAPDRSLWRLWFDETSLHARSELVAEGVLAVVPLKRPGALAVVERYLPAAERGRLAIEILPTWQRPTHIPIEARSPVFLCAVARARTETWVCASQRADGAFTIVRYPSSHTATASDVQTEVLHPPSGTRVIGVDAVTGDVGLFVLDPDARSVSIVGRHRSHVVAKSRAPIVDVTIAPATGRLAYTTEAGELAFVERSGATLWKGSFRA